MIDDNGSMVDVIHPYVATRCLQIAIFPYFETHSVCKQQRASKKKTTRTTPTRGKKTEIKTHPRWVHSTHTHTGTQARKHKHLLFILYGFQYDDNKN